MGEHFSEESELTQKKTIRVFVFSTWAEGVEDAREYLQALPTRDIRPQLLRPDDPDLLRLGRLNCDWEGENLRAFSEMKHPGWEFLPARIMGTKGMGDLIKGEYPENEDRWIIFIAQQPQINHQIIATLWRRLVNRGYHILYWAFDEASRNMPCFCEIAPYVSILIHDEAPLDPRGDALLPHECVRLHTSWVANVVPFSNPFQERVEDKIVFLGSQKGLSEHRVKQISFLQEKFGKQFVPFCDHSVSISEMRSFGRYKVHFCPEGRHFTTPGMSQTHTDRPFWAGCMGQVPIVENSKRGGRLEKEFKTKKIIRYDYDDLEMLEKACRQALECPTEERLSIYNYFNQWGTVGPVAASQIVKFRSFL